jgi:hypothetical protein
MEAPAWHSLVIKYMPTAQRWASRWRPGDDEYESIAIETLCEVAAAYDSSSAACFKTHLWRRTMQRFIKESRRRGAELAKEPMARCEAARLSDILPEPLMLFAEVFFREKRDTRRTAKMMGIPWKNAERLRVELLRRLEEPP